MPTSVGITENWNCQIFKLLNTINKSTREKMLINWKWMINFLKYFRSFYSNNNVCYISSNLVHFMCVPISRSYLNAGSISSNISCLETQFVPCISFRKRLPLAIRRFCNTKLTCNKFITDSENHPTAALDLNNTEMEVVFSIAHCFYDSQQRPSLIDV